MLTDLWSDQTHPWHSDESVCQHWDNRRTDELKTAACDSFSPPLCLCGLLQSKHWGQMSRRRRVFIWVGLWSWAPHPFYTQSVNKHEKKKTDTDTDTQKVSELHWWTRRPPVGEGGVSVCLLTERRISVQIPALRSAGFERFAFLWCKEAEVRWRSHGRPPSPPHSSAFSPKASTNYLSVRTFKKPRRALWGRCHRTDSLLSSRSEHECWTEKTGESSECDHERKHNQGHNRGRRSVSFNTHVEVSDVCVMPK